MFNYYVYILASKRNGTLYIGVTNNLLRRIAEHKCKYEKGFTEKYNVNMLVYFESTNNIFEAIQREKRLKKWKREWKLKLIEEFNPDWKDLFYDYTEGEEMIKYIEEEMENKVNTGSLPAQG